MLRIEPGAPLDEKQLSASLDVGLTPVRDSTKRHTLERLAITYPRRGAIAAEINLSDERWLTGARSGLEGLAALLAAERVTDAERVALLDPGSGVGRMPGVGGRRCWPCWRWRSGRAWIAASTSASAVRPQRPPDLAEWLVAQGIESMSLNPATVVDAWQRLARSACAT